MKDHSLECICGAFFVFERYYFINRFNKNAGQPNSNLTYYDGMINLTYSNGDSYSNGRLRKTQITFLCQIDGKSYLFKNWKADHPQVHILKPVVLMAYFH